MRALPHLLFPCLYASLAAILALLGPSYLPWLDQAGAIGLALATLLGGGLLHSVYARIAREAERRHEVLALGDQLDDRAEELSDLRREVEALRQAMEAAAHSGQLGAGGRTIEGVMAEARVLKSLVPRLESAVLPSTGPDGPVIAVNVHAADAPAPETVLDVVREALRNDRVDLVLQPVVSLPQRKRRFYECFSRLRTADGTVILPEQYIALAARAGLVTAIDNMLLFRCVQLIRKVQRKNDSIDFFCNISPHSLVDVEFFADFVAFLESNEELAPHLIFEFAQSDFARWSEVGATLLDRLAMRGCRFSLDQVTDLDLDPALLAQRRIRFIKIETERLLAEVSRDAGLLRALRRHRIDLIVEKVEDESRLVELLDYEIDFGQGYLFGEPRLARPAA